VKRSTLSRLIWSVALLPALGVASAVGCGSNGPPASSSFDSGLTDAGKHEDVTIGHGGDSSMLTGNDAPTGGGDACAATSKTADVAPLDMYIVLDRSGSMAENDSWTQEVQALTDFVYDVNSSGIGVGIQYMPLPQLCDPSAYALPAVPIAVLPGNTGPVTTSLSSTHPYGGTPTVPALEGAVMLGKQRQKDHPERDFIIVLSTDGVPDTSCSFVGDAGLPNSTANAIAVIKAAANAVPPIKTFVIGVGNEPELNDFAAAGGTGQAILVGAGDAGTAVDIEGPLIAALTAIRTTALPCTYTIPTPEAGTINPADVNVTFTPGSGATQTFYGVGSLAACQTKTDDWYYDDPTSPKNIELCPNSCALVKASTNGTVNVAFGCETLAPPILK
jgi:hypothetical protein